MGKEARDVSDRLEETVAHLLRTVEELSDVVARQDVEIARLTARVEMLMLREAEREADAGGTVPLADKPPPHW
jgi:SlyX protein